jgi:hypothetical protein
MGRTVIAPLIQFKKKYRKKCFFATDKAMYHVSSSPAPGRIEILSFPVAGRLVPLRNQMRASLSCLPFQVLQ